MFLYSITVNLLFQNRLEYNYPSFTVAYILSARWTLHRHVDCGNPLFSVCVPTPDINYHRNIKVVFEVLISDFFTLRSEHEMLRKVPKIKDFYKVFLCIDTIVSTCTECGN